MSDASHNNVAFYCPVHQIRFHTTANEVIQCERSGHTLGSGFPYQSWWMYCCDCATFAPYAPVERNKGQRECLVCERPTAKRFLCNKCRVLSLESNALVRRKDYSIDETAVRPHCPGCGLASASIATKHECAETGIAFFTAAKTCDFCEISIAGPKAPVGKTVDQLFCGKCGTELQTGFKFCKRCGNPSPQQKERVKLAPVKEPDILDIPDEVFAESEEIDLDQADTDELIGIDEGSDPVDADFSSNIGQEATTETPIPRPWEYPEAPATRLRHKSWFLAVGIVVLAGGILVTVMSLGGNRAKSPAPVPDPKPPTVPTYPGMLFLSGGEFTMGSNTGDEYERPAHKVQVAPFYIDVNEVTCEEYSQFVKTQGHASPPDWPNGSYPAGNARKPVTGVSWDDASAYAAWAKKRLPTEEEWEFAARGKNGDRYPWGNDWRGNAANADESSIHAMADVGSYPLGKTSAGVMDMIGNAWEWTSSDVAPYPGGHLSEVAPDGVKIIRGGSWQENKQQATSTYRGFLKRSGAKDYSATGFRCVKDIERVPVNPTGNNQ